MHFSISQACYALPSPRTDAQPKNLKLTKRNNSPRDFNALNKKTSNAKTKTRTEVIKYLANFLKKQIQALEKHARNKRRRKNSYKFCTPIYLAFNNLKSKHLPNLQNSHHIVT